MWEVGEGEEGRAVQHREMQRYAQVQLEEAIEHIIIGESALIQQVRYLVQQVARYPRVTVLLQGESGTGKEVVARAIHTLSQKTPHNFVAINCAALPETLIETELFGVEQGAFTDAKIAREGHVQRANGGTLFLDEIGEMPLHMQAKLLRFLETHRFRRVGGVREFHVEVRVIAATNVDLQRAIAKRTFREDLFYRLNVMTITLPPLRERSEDIMPLAEHYLQVQHEEEERGKTGEAKKVPVRLNSEVRELLTSYSWPGNVRELFAVLQSRMILCDDNTIMPSDLPMSIRAYRESGIQCLRTLSQQLHLPTEGLDLRAFLSSIEQTFVREALARCNGNQVQAAALLGLSRDQLRYRLPK